MNKCVEGLVRGVGFAHQFTSKPRENWIHAGDIMLSRGPRKITLLWASMSSR